MCDICVNILDHSRQSLFSVFHSVPRGKYKLSRPKYSFPGPRSNLRKFRYKTGTKLNHLDMNIWMEFKIWLLPVSWKPKMIWRRRRLIYLLLLVIWFFSVMYFMDGFRIGNSAGLRVWFEFLRTFYLILCKHHWTMFELFGTLNMLSELKYKVKYLYYCIKDLI